MSAHITITRAYGGDAITAGQITQALNEQYIVSGILYEEITNAVQEGEVLKREIAVGKPPQPGEDSQFISLIPEMKDRCPAADEDDHVDYRNLGDIVSVTAGDPLMRLTCRLREFPGRI